MKLPVLIHHYFDHEKEDANLSFISFLKEHYEELHNAKGNHQEEHNRLPFKVHDHQFLAENITLTDPPYISIQFSSYCETTKVSLTNESYRYSHFLADIWQPPRA